MVQNHIRIKETKFLIQLTTKKTFLEKKLYPPRKTKDCKPKKVHIISKLLWSNYDKRLNEK